MTGIQAMEAEKLRSESFGHSRSNGAGSDLLRAATVLESSLAAAKLQQLADNEKMISGGYGWSGIEEGVVENKIQPVVSPKIGESPDRARWKSRGFFKLWSPMFWLFSGDMDD